MGFSLGPSLSAEHDSNVLRSSGTAAIPEIADTITSTGLAGSFHSTYGREDIQASALVARELYDHLTSFDYTYQNLSATVSADLPLQAAASLSVQRSAQMAHFEDVQLAVPDIIDTNAGNVSLDFPVTLDWRGVLNGLFEHMTNSAASMQAGNVDVSEGDYGIRYQPVSGNHLDLLARVVSARFPQAALSELINPGYHEHGVDLRGEWTLTGASHVHGDVGYDRRRYDPPAFQINPIFYLFDPILRLDRDFSGPAFDLSYAWSPTGPIQISAEALKQTGAAGDNNYLSAVTRTLRLTGAYQPREKFTLKTSVELGHRNYFSSIYQAVYGLPPGTIREDAMQNIGLGADWQPRRWAQLSIDIHREHRDSSISTWIYSNSVVALSGKFLFQ